MIYFFEKKCRQFRSLISRSEWFINLLKLKISSEEATSKGLVLIQIDGLAYKQFNQALIKGKLPFIKKLIKKEQYNFFEHYSGLPSNTPAVQGELFYGVKTCVPAFNFKDRDSGEIIRMFDKSCVSKIEDRLKLNNKPLLENGSAYADIYTGGAKESHFCASSFGWGSLTRGANPFVLLLFIFSHIYSFFRIIFVLILEFFISIVDFFRGIILKENIFKELKFIPTRVAICILLRELCVIGVKMDIARGLPIIHVNFLGYDEQAHRRGPSSNFAHWTLKGIDDSIARIWRAAKRSKKREYDVWIYSDHGQETTKSYYQTYNISINNAINKIIHSNKKDSINISFKGIQSQRVSLLGGKKIQNLLSKLPFVNEIKFDVIVTAMGPLGMVYLENKHNNIDIEVFVNQLLNEAHIPLIFYKNVDEIRAVSKYGNYILPNDKNNIFGANHPFLEEVSKDFIRIINHPNAGDIIISGWDYKSVPFSFPAENGAHAGPGFEETRGFGIFPCDINFDTKRTYIRPIDIRNSVFNFFDNKILSGKDKYKSNKKNLRIMTYNIHSCKGMDGKTAPKRIARLIARHSPDIVALQEVDVNKERSGNINQAEIIAKTLNMNFIFYPAIKSGNEQYGIAILSFHPLTLKNSAILPSIDFIDSEPRCAIWASFIFNNIEYQIINTHLSLNREERKNQVMSLMSEEWIDNEECKSPVILCGDFNFLPLFSPKKKLLNVLKDSVKSKTKPKNCNTWFSRLPILRIDHIFVDENIKVNKVEIPHTEFSKKCSDHLPLLVDINLVQNKND